MNNSNVRLSKRHEWKSLSEIKKKAGINGIGEAKRFYPYLLDLIFIIVISYISLQHIDKLNNIVIVDDQLGYWGIAAQLAGYDWSEMVSMASYYGFGYPLLLVPILKLGLEPGILYKTAIILNVFFLLVSYGFARISAAKLFGDVNVIWRSIICFLSVMYGNNIVQSNTAWSETLLYMLFWISFYLIILIEEKITFCRTVILICVCIYMHAVHQRSIGVVVSAGIVLVLKIMTSEDINIRKDIKKYARSVFIVICIAVALLIVSVSVKNYVIDNLWSSAETDILAANDYKGQIDKIKALLNIDNIGGYVTGICGKIYYLTVASFFSGVLGYIYCVERIWGKTVKKDNDDSWIIYIYCMLAISAEVMITAVYMGGGFPRADILLYGRYMEFVFGPLMMIGFGYLLRNKLQSKLFLKIVIGMILCTFIIEPVYEETRNLDFNGICATQFVQFFHDWEKWGRQGLLYSITGLLIMMIALIHILSQKFPKAGIIVMAVVCLNFWNKNVDYTFQSNDKWDLTFSESYLPIRDVLKDSAVDEITFLDSDIELKKTHLDSDVYMKQLQFTLYDIMVHKKTIGDISDMKFEDDQWYIIEKGISEESDIRRRAENIVIDNDCFLVFHN